jgi:hypothetical protein
MSTYVYAMKVTELVDIPEVILVQKEIKKPVLKSGIHVALYNISENITFYFA